MAQTVKRLPTVQETQVQSLGQEDLLEKEMATHSSILFFFFPLQYSYLEFPSDRGAWWATVHGVVKSQIRLKELSLHAIYVIIKVYIPNT